MRSTKTIKKEEGAAWKKLFGLQNDADKPTETLATKQKGNVDKLVSLRDRTETMKNGAMETADLSRQILEYAKDKYGDDTAKKKPEKKKPNKHEQQQKLEQERRLQRDLKQTEEKKKQEALRQERLAIHKQKAAEKLNAIEQNQPQKQTPQPNIVHFKKVKPKKTSSWCCFPFSCSGSSKNNESEHEMFLHKGQYKR